MPIIQPPKVVQNAVDEFLAPLLKNKPQRKHLANYLTGLILYFRNTAKNKTVAGMTEELPNASDPSLSQSVFQQTPMTEVDWDAGAVNDARIEMMQQSEDTRLIARVASGLDDVLIGKNVEAFHQFVRLILPW